MEVPTGPGGREAGRRYRVFPSIKRDTMRNDGSGPLVLNSSRPQFGHDEIRMGGDGRPWCNKFLPPPGTRGATGEGMSLSCSCFVSLDSDNDHGPGHTRPHAPLKIRGKRSKRRYVKNVVVLSRGQIHTTGGTVTVGGKPRFPCPPRLTTNSGKIHQSITYFASYRNSFLAIAFEVIRSTLY